MKKVPFQDEIKPTVNVNQMEESQNQMNISLDQKSPFGYEETPESGKGTSEMLKEVENAPDDNK